MQQDASGKKSHLMPALEGYCIPVFWLWSSVGAVNPLEMEYHEASGDDEGDDDGPVYEDHTNCPDADAAQHNASAMMEQSAQLFGTIKLTLSGRPDIIV